MDAKRGYVKAVSSFAAEQVEQGRCAGVEQRVQSGAPA